MRDRIPAWWCICGVGLSASDHANGGHGDYRKVNRGFQYSLSYWASSGEISEPYELVLGVLEGAQMMIMPSVQKWLDL